MAAGDAAFTSLMNTGDAATSTRVATAPSLTNTGADPKTTGTRAASSLLNTGLPLPPVISLKVPQIGWQTPLKPAQILTLQQDFANAVEYTYEGDVHDPLP